MWTMSSTTDITDNKVAVSEMSALKTQIRI